MRHLRRLILLFACPLAAVSAPLSATQDSRSETLTTLSQEARDAFKAGHLELAADRLQTMLDELQRGEDQFNDTVPVAFDLGIVLSDLGQYREADRAYTVAVAAATRAYGADSYDTHRAMGAQARNWGDLGRFAEAERQLRGLLEEPYLAQDLKSGVNGALAQVLDNQGRYLEAEAYHRTALQIAEEREGATSESALKELNNLAFNLFRQGRNEEAQVIQRTLAKRNDASPDRSFTQEADRSSAFAASLDSIGDYLNAEVYHEAAVEAARKTGNPLVLGNTLQNHSVNQANFGRFDLAAKLGTEAYQELLKALPPDHPRILGLRNNLATVLIAMGENKVAAEGLSKVLRSIESAGLKDTQLFRSALGNLAVAMIREPELASRAIYPAGELARLAVERRRLFDRDDSAQNARKASEMEHRAVMAVYVEALWQARGSEHAPSGSTKDAELAFMAAQDALISPATRAIASRAAARAARQNPAIAGIVRERLLISEKIGNLEARLADELASLDPQDSALRSTLRDGLAKARSQLAEIDGQLRQSDPRYFNWLQPEPLGIEVARRYLSDDEGFILALPGPYATHVFAISKDGFLWHRPEWKRDDIENAARRLLWDVGANIEPSIEERERWNIWEDRPGSASFDRTTAHALYNQLFAPLEGILAGKRHVFVSASDTLSNMPLGMLVTRPPEGEGDGPEALRNTGWFADRHALVQLPSLQSLAFLRRQPDSSKGRYGREFFGVGDPVLEGESAARGQRGTPIGTGPDASSLFAGARTETGAPLADVQKIRAMSRLPGTARELTAIRTALSAPQSDLLLGETATEAAVKNASLDADVLVFATHGLLASDSQSTGEPGLVLTPPAKATALDDGFLSASEIAALEISAGWLILSACNTAASDGSPGGSGLSGIARAFFYAGAENLLASHWPVADDIAAELTLRAVVIMRENPALSRAEAFQLASRSIREDTRKDGEAGSWAHPYAWAPFTMIGDGAAR